MIGAADPPIHKDERRCWADVPPDRFRPRRACAEWGDFTLGLCEEHALEIVGSVRRDERNDPWS